MSSNFETTRELLSPSILSGGVGDDSTNLETVPVLPWIPKTTAAVALRLIEFDAAISYTLKQRAETHKGAGECMVSTSFYTVNKSWIYKAEILIQRKRKKMRFLLLWVGIGRMLCYEYTFFLWYKKGIMATWNFYLNRT